MLPGATWEPVHELRARTGAKTISLSSYAVVMQTTGEDWTGVQLALSTQKSTETLKIPELDALLVGSGRRIAHIMASSAGSFAAARENYAGQNGLFNAVVNTDALVQEEYRKNQKVQLDNEQRVSQLFETLQRRGTTAHFSGSGIQTVRADGRSVRVPIGSVELEAVQKIIAAPEVSLNAARTVDLANTSKQSLIPGKVAIYLEGAFLGLTETDFVAPGESFSLYLGVADQIKLSRTLDKKRSELKSGGAKTRMQLSFVSTVENLSKESQSIQMAERVPVSEMDEVKVSNVRIQPVGKPDVKGLLHWDLNLAPRQAREFRVEYTLEYPTQLPARKVTPLPGIDASGVINLHEQIKSLELELRK